MTRAGQKEQEGREVGGDSSAEGLKHDASDDDKDHEIANLRYQLRQSIQQQQVLL